TISSPAVSFDFATNCAADRRKGGCAKGSHSGSTARVMESQQDSLNTRPAIRAAAFSVHIFTAFGGAVALLAMLEAVREHWVAMFQWLGAALVIDAIDGPIARRLNVKLVQPNLSGDVLDLVVDFVTYVFVPAYAIVASGLLLPIAAPILGVA